MPHFITPHGIIFFFLSPFRWDLMEEEDSSLCLWADSLECVLPELADLSPVPISLMADVGDLFSNARS
jgi:hypothetical protein